MYVGIAWATALIRISRPPINRIFSFHPGSFFSTLSLISANISTFDLPIIEGRPSYFFCRVSCIGLNISNTSHLLSSGVLLLKKTEDLSALIFWPEAALYSWRISIRFWHSWRFALQNNRLFYEEQMCDLGTTFTYWYSTNSLICIINKGGKTICTQ